MQIDLSAVEKSLESVSEEPTSQAILEKQSYEERYNNLRIQEFSQNLQARKRYANFLFIMVCVWLTLMLFFILFQGVGKIPFTETYRFELSDPVLITLITTTTANVAGFFLVVVKHLFPTNDKN